ncbi:MAG: hypothetical protein ACI4J4_06310 [Ruminiclostridium sp.]
MNYKKLFEQSFSNIVPSKDSKAIMQSVIERTERTDMENTKKKGIRKPFAAVAAAAAAVALGVTGAAAAGIIDFNEIFGNEIKTEIENSYLLMSRTENVEAYASDQDYNVTLLGVTGGNDCAIASIEISRKDGKPVTDYFLNRNDNSTLFGFISAECNWENPDTDSRYYSSAQINEAGNIVATAELSVEFDQLDDISLAGRKISITGNGFYPGEDLFNYIDEIGAKRTDFGASYSDGTQADISSVASLPLEWSVSFDYYPSESSAQRLHIKEADKEKEITLKRKPIDGETIEYKVTVRSIELGCTRAVVELREEKQEFPFSFPDNTILLITGDGKEISADFSGGMSRSYGDYEISQQNLKYYSESPEQGYIRLAVDVSEIAAISINGEIFELE